MKPQDIERFHSKVTPQLDGCWHWTGALDGRGYGKFSIRDERGKKFLIASRVAWSLHHKDSIPEGMSVLHKCDSPHCVNPHHLFLGTQSDNMVDCVRKGRHGPFNKLTPDAVREIRESKEPGRVMAKKFGISNVMACAIRRREAWAHV